MLQHYRFVEANQTFCAQMGLSIDQLQDFTLKDFHGDLAENRQVNRSILTNGYQIRNAETDELDALGRRKYFLNNVVCDVRDGYVWGGWCTQTDITELREAQQALLQAEQDCTAELAKANDALKRSLDSLASEPSLDKFLGQVLTAIAEQFDAPQVEYWYHPTADFVYIGMMSCRGAIYNRDQIALLYPDHPGIIGTPTPQDMRIEPLIQRKQPLIRDNSAIPLYKEHADRYALSLYQELNLPMILGETNIGTLVIRLSEDYQITTQQIELAQALAHQATLAVQLTRLAEEAKQAAIAREQEKAAQERAAELAKANDALKRSLLPT